MAQEIVPIVGMEVFVNQVAAILVIAIMAVVIIVAVIVQWTVRAIKVVLGWLQQQ